MQTRDNCEMALFAELNPAPVIGFDSVGGEIFNSNDAASLIFERDILIGTSLYEMVPALAAAREIFQNLNKNDGIHQEQVGVADKLYLFTFRSRKDSAIVHGYGADITQQHQVTQKLEAATLSLQEKEEHLSAMAAFAHLNPAPVLRFDLDGTILMANPKALEIFEESSLEGTSWFSVTDEYSREDFENLLTDDSTLQQEIDLGESRFLFTFRSQRNSINAYGADITERYGYEKAMIEAKELAENATRAKSAFLANMSHELRTPLNGLVGMVDLLCETPLTVGQKDYAQTIQTASDALLTIVNDILDLSKINAGQLQLEMAPLNLRFIAEETVNLFSAAAREKGLEFVLRYPPDGPETFTGDGLRIRQILSNLMGNAVKFTESGYVSLQIEFSPSEQDGIVMLTAHVKDCGIGISPENVDRIFEQFSQEDSSTTRRYGGTGLGLAICANLTDLMGGKIGANSELGAGSDFWFTIPLEEARENSIPDVHSLTPGEMAGRRALIVDDLELNCKTLSEQVRSWNMEATYCTQPHLALELIQTASQEGKPFHYAILDYQMPGLNGMDLAGLIRDAAIDQDIVLLMLSSVSLNGKRKALEKMGFDAALEKPVRQADLKEALRNTGSRRVGQHARQSPGETEQASTSSQTPQRNSLNLSVLVVEDMLMNQKVVSSMLERFGCNVEVAENGQIGIKMLEAGANYDLVIMDCQMPVMDGFDATRLIRASDSQYSSIPIIAMTGNAMSGDRERCLSAGMSQYLSKPVKIESLYDALEPMALPS